MTTSNVSEHAGQIVVGVDGSEGAVQAALWAADEAARHHVPVRLVHSYFQPYLYYPPFATSTTGNNVLLAQARRELDEVTAVVRTACPTVTVHPDFRYGHPVSTLQAESSAARMLVLGARGRRGFDGLVLGSVAGSVAAHAHCPVAVVHGVAGQSSQPVVVGVDGSPVSETAVALAFDEASTRRVGLIAIHAWDELPDQRLFSLAYQPEQVRRAEADEHRLLAERLAGWQEKYPDVTVERVVVRQHPAAALLQHAARAQLVVVGSHGRGGFAGMLLGSTSQAMLRHAPCPVIVARAART